jgi:YVTN family beta-propeller protein
VSVHCLRSCRLAGGAGIAGLLATLGVVGALASSASAAPSYGVTATITVADSSTAPWAVAVDPTTDTLFVTDVGSGGAGTVKVINENTDAVMATINVGTFPESIAVDTATHRVYVTSTAGTVKVISEATDTVIDTVTVGPLTLGVAVDAVTNTIYAVNYDNDSVSVINGATDVVAATIPLSTAPLAVAVDPVTDTVYVTSDNLGNPSVVSVINGSTNTVTTNIGVGVYPDSIAVNPTTDTVYVVNDSGINRMSVIDGATNTVTATLTSASVDATGNVDVDRGTNIVYVATDGDNLTLLDGATNLALATVAVGDEPAGVAVDTTTHKAFAANNYDVTVSVVSALTLAGGGGAASASVNRLAGSHRFATAVAASNAGFTAGSAGAVVLARSDSYTDALVAAPLAAAKKGPLLLTSGTTLPVGTKSELQRVLAPGGTVYLVGGIGAIPASIQTQLTGLGYTAVRLQGADRYATAVAVAGALGDPRTVLLTTGINFPDGLAAGPAATQVGGVVLLTDGVSMPTETQTYLTAHATTSYAIGGPAVTADPTATAVTGADRYATAAAVAAKFFTGPTVAGVATGATFPDALAGGALLANLKGPLLLTAANTLPSTTSSYLKTNPTLATVDLFGGTAAISNAVSATITASLPQ